MRPRSMFCAAAMAALALFGSACSSDDKADETTTTAVDSTDVDSPTTTISDEDFTKALDEATATMTAAGTEGCAPFAAFQGLALPSPSNAAQVEESLTAFSEYIKQLADTVEADKPEKAAELDKGADALLEVGKKTDFVPEAFTSEAMASQDLIAAQGVIVELSGECASSAGTAQGDGAESPAGPATTVPG